MHLPVRAVRYCSGKRAIETYAIALRPGLLIFSMPPHAQLHQTTVTACDFVPLTEAQPGRCLCCGQGGWRMGKRSRCRIPGHSTACRESRQTGCGTGCREGSACGAAGYQGLVPAGGPAIRQAGPGHTGQEEQTRRHPATNLYWHTPSLCSAWRVVLATAAALAPFYDDGDRLRLGVLLSSLHPYLAYAIIVVMLWRPLTALVRVALLNAGHSGAATTCGLARC